MNAQKVLRTLPLLLLTAAILMILGACGSSSTDNAAANASGADLEAGKRIYQANCSSCHSTDKGVVLVGPSLAGLSSRAGSIVSGLDAEAYIQQSILEPEAYLNDGYQNLMPPIYAEQLTQEDLDNLVAYLLTIK